MFQKGVLKKFEKGEEKIFLSQMHIGSKNDGNNFIRLKVQ